MGTSTAYLVMMAIGFLIFISFIGFIFLSFSTSKTSKKYRAFILELKKQNKYKEWAEQHKNLVTAQKVFQYSGVIFILALLVFLGIVKEVFSAPRIVLVVSGVLVYAFWPFSFISMLVITRLYKKVPEIWK